MRPCLILLNGFAASGKTTLAQRYIDEHPLALAIEGDRIIVHLGQWHSHEEEARGLIFELTKALARTHLALGRDVVLPYLLTDPAHADAFKTLAVEAGAAYHEIFLFDDKQDAIAKLMARGRWGEDGLDPLTGDDLPVIEDLYDRMVRASQGREARVIRPIPRDVDGTYQEILAALR